MRTHANGYIQTVRRVGFYSTIGLAISLSSALLSAAFGFDGTRSRVVACSPRTNWNIEAAERFGAVRLAWCGFMCGCPKDGSWHIEAKYQAIIQANFPILSELPVWAKVVDLHGWPAYSFIGAMKWFGPPCIEGAAPDDGPFSPVPPFYAERSVILDPKGRFNPYSGWVTGPRLLPLQPIWTGLMANTLCFGIASWLVASFVRMSWRSQQRRRGKCTRCGYDLRGAASRGCPECGWGRDPGKTGTVSNNRDSFEWHVANMSNMSGTCQDSHEWHEANGMRDHRAYGSAIEAW